MTHHRSLLCYTRKPTGQEHANNADIAFSLHLALRSTATGGWDPLNDNYGIYFVPGSRNVPARPEATTRATPSRPLASTPAPSSTPVPASDDVLVPGVDIILHGMRSPWLSRLADGRFMLSATRTQRGGAPDGSENDGFLLAVSSDLISYRTVGMVTIRTSEGVESPRVSFLGPESGYLVSWRTRSGLLRAALTPDIITAAESSTPLEILERQEHETACERSIRKTIPETIREKEDADLPATTTLPADAIAGNVISIGVEEADTLLRRFGRLYNTGAHVDSVRLKTDIRPADVDETVETMAATRVTLDYWDGSTATRAVDWDMDRLREIVASASQGRVTEGDTARVTGHVRLTPYPVPFAAERADPSVFPWSWNGTPLFLFVATDDADGNCVDPHDGRTHLILRTGSSILDLSDAHGGREREIDLLSRGDLNSEGRAMTGCFWAPELHVIGGRLSILFMPCFDGPELDKDGHPNDRAGKPDMWTGRCHIMRLNRLADGRDADPRDPTQWSTPEPITGPHGEDLNLLQGICLDMTASEDSGRWYYAWQQIGSVWMATFDPQDPTRLTSMPSQLIVPEYAWDNLIAEGPNVTKHGGRLQMIYSGSLVGADYTTGLATARAGVNADLLDPASWTVMNQPIQKSGLYNGAWQWGTGHGMWSRDEEGNALYVFHSARLDSGEYHGRDAQVRRVHWASDGHPVLDMQTDEEADPAYTADIAMTINVG
jgi:GH43 family beta-xylosidase